MKKIISRIVIFILPIILLAYPLDILLSRFISKQFDITFLTGEMPIWSDIYDGKIDAEIAIYGSSRAWVQINNNLMTDSLGYNSYNFGIDGHNFLLQYLRHKEFLKYNQPPKLIIVSVDYGTLSTVEGNKGFYNQEQFFPHMLWNKDIMEYTSSYDGAETVDYIVPLARYMGEFKLFADAINISLKDEKSLTVRKKGYLGKDLKFDIEFYEERKERGPIEFKLEEQLIELFKQFLEECKEKNIEVILSYTPIYTEGQELIPDNNEVVELLKEISSEYDLDYLDYLNDDICDNQFYFYNVTHLNSGGSDLFTNKFLQDLKNTKAFRKLGWE